MGLLDRIRSARRPVEAAKRAAESLLLDERIGFDVERSTPAPAGPALPNERSETGDPTAYIESILRSEFPQYTLTCGLPVERLQGSGKPYDFAVYRDGLLRGVIMVTEHNRDNNAAFKGARAAAETAGIPFINFYAHMPNERVYVINRLRQYLT